MSDDYEVRKARQKLRTCQQERDSFMLRHPDHPVARKTFELQITKLNEALDRLIRGDR